MRLLPWGLTFATACQPSDAERLESALTASSFPEAAAACAQVAGVAGERCLVDVAERHDRRAVEDCSGLADPLWQDECRFRLAERLARAGDAEAALAQCDTTRFSRECSYHLLREVARAALHEDPAQAAALAPWRSLAGVPDAPRLFWKAWFREGRAAGLVVRPDGCPESACEQAARETMFESLRALYRADRAGFCARPPEGVSGWADTPTIRAWAGGWAADTCARDALPGARAIPPRP